jgi:hypothetical protein
MSTPDFSGFNPRLQTPLMWAGETDEPGVYIDWDRSGRSNVAKYEVLRATHFDGEYERLDTLDFPANEYVDEGGRPEYYYRIRELDDQDQVLGTSQPIIGEEVLVRASLRYQLKDFMKLRIRNEQAEFNDRHRTTSQFVFGNWNYWPRPVLRINGSSEEGSQDPMIPLSETDPLTSTLSSEFVEDYPDGLKFKLDYQGRAYFIDGQDQPAHVQPYSYIEGTYAVRAFSCQEMNNALNMALQELNSLAGTTKYRTVHQTPYWYETALVTGGTYQLLKGLLLGLTTREKRLLLEDPEGGKNIDDLREMLKMYQEDWKSVKDTLPKARYPRSMLIITPQYHLPGGRSRMFRELFKQDSYM